MKKIISSLAALLLVMCNCSNEEIESKVTSQGKTSINAVIEEPVIARATIDTESGTFSWTDGDMMDVNTTNGEKEFTYNINNGKFESTEEVTIKDYAVYPSAVTYNNGKVTLPDSYTLGALTNRVNATMLATNFEQGTESFKLKHLGGIIHFNLNNVPSNANKLVFTADNTITGEFTIEDEKISAPSNKVATNNVVSLNFTAANEARDLNFFVPVPTGSYKMQVALYADETLLYEGAGSTSNTIGRATLLNMPQIDCGSWYNDNLSVFTIVNKDQLKEFADKVNSGISFAGKTVKLAADLDMTEVTWTPIGSLSPKHYFSGTFDGGNHTISNLKVEVTDGAAGLFGAVQNCVAIKNVKLSNVNVSSNHYAGALVGWFQENGSTKTPTISDCSVSNATIKVSPNTVNNGYDNGDKAGALVGYAASNVNITNCSVITATVTGYRDLGGIVGHANSNTYGDVNITVCTVSNLTLMQNLENGYKADYPTTLGAVYGRGSSPDVTDNFKGLTSLTIKNCTPAYAQGALDAANTPRTIELTAGEFGTLYLRWNTASKSLISDWAGGGHTYLRTIKNLTIQGTEGTKATSIVAESATYAGTEHSLSSTHTYLQTYMNVQGLTIKNIEFTPAEGKPAVAVGSSGHHIAIDGLTIDNCIVNGTNCTKDNDGNRLYITEVQNVQTYHGLECVRKNITITNCTMNNLHQGMKINYAENLSISGNKFNNIKGRDMLFSCTEAGLIGNIFISGNNSNGSTERFIRMTGLKGSLSVKNNIVTNYTGADTDIVKITGSASEASITFLENTWMGDNDDAAINNGKIIKDK